MTPPEDDHSEAGDLRREILDLAREIGIDLGAGAGSGPPASPPAPPRRVRSRGREELDLRASTPFLLVRVMRLLARRLGHEGEPRTSRDLILAEAGRSGAGRPRRIAHALVLRPSTLSGILRRAERDGLLLRPAHRADARLRLVVLTDEGAQEAEKAVVAWRSLDEALARWLGEDDRAELRRLLRRLARALDRGEVGR